MTTVYIKHIYNKAEKCGKIILSYDKLEKNFGEKTESDIIKLVSVYDNYVGLVYISGMIHKRLENIYVDDIDVKNNVITYKILSPTKELAIRNVIIESCRNMIYKNDVIEKFLDKFFEELKLSCEHL